MMRIICSWKVLFEYAGALGKARVAYRKDPSDENAKAVARAEKEHDAYRDMCLAADEMIHFPDISPAALAKTRPAP